ncbi:unnamed protein product [Fraxinus pennsylvanica]|uniref:Hexosyltransferase n=1 Tax=Fraxinus pennsylvanica TaxID=56036 RepID=A0AAD2A5J5_9LAMI|nr:unnamed protein product [Fraxinus pennsylvanica]
MFVFEPSKLTYENLLQTLQITPPTPFAEQDFLNMFFEKVYKPIPLICNLVLVMLWQHPENIELEQVKVVRYCDAREDIKMLVKKWWDVYDDSTLNFKAEDTAQKGTMISKSTVLASLPEPAVSYIPAPSAA